MAREEFDESLYRRPKKEEDAGEGDGTKRTEDAPSGTSPEDAGDAPETEKRSAWDDDDGDGAEEGPVSRRRFMPDDDEEPEPPAKKSAPEDGGDGKKTKKAEGKSAGKKASGDVRKGRRRITSGASFYGDDESHAGLRKGLVWGLCVVLFAVVAAMTLSSFIDMPALDRPKSAVSRVVGPVQRLFSSFTDSVASYVRTLKIRGEVEYEYEQLLVKLDELASQAALAEEYKYQLDQLYDLMDEMERNTAMDPVSATVIGHDTGNYFSVLTIDVGSDQGVSENMAVVFSGGLVGYTYNVEKTTCSVLCIIDGDATVAAMVQSSRDQGSVKGTLSVDGTANCRMYYLPDDSLPRPGDLVVTSGVGVEFPKGIPIGYVRESTRGMEDNKSYIVVEPIVDFQHLEYVVVYRYRPAYTEAVQQRSSYSEATLIPHPSARPQPTFQVGDMNSFDDDGMLGTPSAEETPVPEATPTPGPSPSVTPTADPNATPPPDNLTYRQSEEIAGTPTPTPSPTPTPTPTPVPTFDPGSMTVEEDDNR